MASRKGKGSGSAGELERAQRIYLGLIVQILATYGDRRIIGVRFPGAPFGRPGLFEFAPVRGRETRVRLRSSLKGEESRQPVGCISPLLRAFMVINRLNEPNRVCVQLASIGNR